MSRFIAIIIIITATTTGAGAQPRPNAEASSGSAFGPTVEATGPQGPTQAAFDRWAWEQNRPPHQETGPYGLRSAERPPRVDGLRAFGGGIPAAKDNLRVKMARRKAFKQRHRPTGWYGVKRKGRLLGRSFKEAALSYGQTFSQAGSGLIKSFLGE